MARSIPRATSGSAWAGNSAHASPTDSARPSTAISSTSSRGPGPSRVMTRRTVLTSADGMRSVGSPRATACATPSMTSTISRGLPPLPASIRRNAPSGA